MSRLEEIAARVAAATPGPWVVAKTFYNPRNIADAAFIVAARDDVPFLLAEVERLRAGLTAIVAALDSPRPEGPDLTTDEVEAEWIALDDQWSDAIEVVRAAVPEAPGVLDLLNAKVESGELGTLDLTAPTEASR